MAGISALNSGALWLNTINPRIQSLADYTPKDKIAVPGIKTSYAAVILEMAVAKQFGMDNYTRLDPNMVGLAHPDAYTAMMSGSTEITSHMASPPFSYQELKNPKVHRGPQHRGGCGPDDHPHDDVTTAVRPGQSGLDPGVPGSAGGGQ